MARRRIGGAGGGSDKGRGGTGLLAVGAAVLIGIGGTGVGIGASVSGGSSGVSSSSSGARAPRSGTRVTVRVDNNNSKAAEARLLRRGIRIDGRATHDAEDCANHSYGEVTEFLRNHPCIALHRAYLLVRPPRGGVVLLAASWVQMATEDEAQELKALLDTDGTGNITELTREKGAYRTVRFTGDVYASRRDGTIVSNAQAQPVLSGKTGLNLTRLAVEAIE